MHDNAQHARLDHVRCRVLDVPISVLDLNGVAAVVAEATKGPGGYVGVCNVHSVVAAARDQALKEALEGALVNTADGRPLFWVLRLLGQRGAAHVYGQALMERLLDGMSVGVTRHFLVGSTEAVQQQLMSRIRERFKSAHIVGRWVPPFTADVPELPPEARELIVKAKPHVVWVALGCPRQEKWMSQYWSELAPSVLIGVGAAFDFIAGTKPSAPRWMRKAGLEWVFRLFTEPRRLTWRYLSTNPVFLWRVAGQFVRGSITS